MSLLVLVAASDPFNLGLLSDLCQHMGCRVATAADGGAALDIVARSRPDLIVLEAALPIMDGCEVTRILKSDRNLAEIPVLLVTRADDPEERAQCLAAGAADCLTSPFKVTETQERVRRALRGLRRSGPSAIAGPLQRERPSHPPYELADELTGAGTLSQLHITLDYEFIRSVRYGHALTCLVLRVADYDAVIADSGLAAAQQHLVKAAEKLAVCVRGVDQVFRSAADEFAILLPETNRRGAAAVVKRIRQALDSFQRADSEGTDAVGTRLGIATYPQTKAREGLDLLNKARSALK
ncbi:MAG: response regulator [Proteobacteria bacterium]|nr:response regulator [Pseudomonadota bacterium]